MNKIILYMLLLLVTATPVFAQKEKKVDPKHINFFKDAKVETDDYIVEVFRAFFKKKGLNI